MDQVKIPKVIMQTWKTNKIPEKWRESLESIKEHMPDWSYHLMTDEDCRIFIAQHFPDFLPYYNNFEYNIQRADAIRYCWLYIQGGIYLDLDIQILKPLDDLFYSPAPVYLIPSNDSPSYMNNCLMASQAKSPFWLEVIEEMKKPLPFWALGKHLKVLNSTGQMMLSRVAKRAKVSSPQSYTLLPTKKIIPCSVCDQICRSEGSYTHPLPGQTWNQWDSYFYNFLNCHQKGIFLTIILIVIFYFIWRSNR